MVKFRFLMLYMFRKPLTVNPLRMPVSFMRDEQERKRN